MSGASKNVKKSASRGRLFAPGNPGGPGRPQGSRNAATLFLDQMADGQASEILAKVITKAKGGDLKASELILARAWPARKGRRVAFNLPTIVNGQDVLAAISSMLSAVASGEITPEEAALVAALLETKRKALETIVIEERLTKLERTHR